MQLFFFWDSVSTKAEDWHFCLEHCLCSWAWEFWWWTMQHAAFGTLPLLAPLATRAACVLAHSHCYLPEQANFSILKGNPGTASRMVYSCVTRNIYEICECKMHPVSLPALWPTLPCKILVPPYSPKRSCTTSFVTRHTSSAVCYKKQLPLVWEL